MTQAGVIPLEPEHLGPQAGPSWAEGAGGRAGPQALPDGPSARAAVSDAGGGPSCRVQASCPHRKGRPQGRRSSGQSPGLHGSAGGVSTCWGGVQGTKGKGEKSGDTALGVSSDTFTLS